MTGITSLATGVEWPWRRSDIWRRDVGGFGRRSSFGDHFGSDCRLHLQGVETLTRQYVPTILYSLIGRYSQGIARNRVMGYNPVPTASNLEKSVGWELDLLKISDIAVAA